MIDQQAEPNPQTWVNAMIKEHAHLINYILVEWFFLVLQSHTSLSEILQVT